MVLFITPHYTLSFFFNSLIFYTIYGNNIIYSINRVYRVYSGV